MNPALLKNVDTMDADDEVDQERPLFEVPGRFIYKSDFINVLKKLEIHEGEVLFIHSDIATFGKLATLDKTFLLDSLIEAFQAAVGPTGTLIMPTFTYDFCENRVYDVKKSRSTVGVLTEYFRNKKDVDRTIQPIFSVAIWGANKDYFLDIDKDSFGKNSIFGKLLDKKAKIVFFGTDFDRMTFIHFVEQQYNVVYRYKKRFHGYIMKDERLYEDDCDYFVRDLQKNVLLNLDKFFKHLQAIDAVRSVDIGKGRVFLVAAETIYKEGFRCLDKDMYFFLQGDPDLHAQP